MTLPRFRQVLLAIVAVGLVGLGAELLLLGHYDGYWQLVPVVLLGVGALAIGWHWLDQGRRSVRGFQVVMAAYVVSGVAGMILHFNGNADFEREMVPEIAGWPLVAESMTGATPVLAPGAMIQLGLLGLLYTFRHPALVSAGAANRQPLE